MPFDVSTADIEGRWRVLSAEETDVAFLLMTDAERKVRLARPALLAFYTALPADTLSPLVTVKADLLETIRVACANAVIRVVRNPDVNARQDIGADGSIGISFDTRADGGLFISEEDLEDIDAAVAAADGVPYSRARSRVLKSSFPWRDSGDVTTIFPPNSPAVLGGLMPFQIGNL